LLLEQAGTCTLQYHRSFPNSYLCPIETTMPLGITGNDIPEEVWGLIASYLPEEEVTTLISVNRAFFNFVLHGKYQEVRWTKLDLNFVDLLCRLQ
jgi:hypothetical protein